MSFNSTSHNSPNCLVCPSERDLPVGYKQTEVGLLPEDWIVEPLENFTSFISYGFTNPMPTVFSGPYMITARDISASKIQYKSARNTSTEAFQKLLTAKSKPQKNDLLLTKDGTLGRLALVEDELICINQSVAILRPNQRIVPSFFLVLLESPYYQNRMIEDAGGSTIKHIYITIVNRMQLGVPSCLKEQTAIANALSDVDALIQELEKLIAKKQAIKTATMQQLLTGRTRLPQFAHHPDGRKKGYKPSELGEIPEDWEASGLASMVSTLNAGVSVNSIDRIDAFTHGKHILKTSCVTSGYFNESEIKSILPIDLNRAKCSPEAGCIIVSRMNTPALVGEIGYVSQDYPEMFLPDRLWQMKFKADSSLNSRWLAYVLSYPSTAKKIKEAATGTSDSMKNISKGGLLALRILTPSFNEQTAIATILSDMDEEIQALDQRLNKTRQIKQGMMQELLTGKTRLVKPAGAAE
ncbi:restriction endonuclease subunit S [Vibrio cholerae]|uniref:restriction endonuclease subunit S n=1 Tax=Vibrio cholerae TaxID=666 RepID=UPI0011D86FCD|nr:restriction endonuclease subunit S [Vibrio cholerae]EGR2426824.1 restriction endonuclease subunit S [Vibrio cholerae]TXZ72483.1 restriction endonuclease subunit S [Vibrio cholerae]GHX56240.1 restriction endonuclease subunit S [Vibrio cholerae]GHZ82365.1 restriction endonuclease subunit S [Vibrio cholerae]